MSQNIPAQVPTKVLTTQAYHFKHGDSVVIENHRTYLNADSYDSRKATKTIAVHCADTLPSFNGDITDIRSWHLQREFRDVGYHYVILRNGTIQTGRPHWAEGSHASGYNRESLAICLMGGKLPSGEPIQGNAGLNDIPRLYTEDQMRSLAFLLANLKFYGKAQYKGVDRRDNHTYFNTRIQGHRDYPNVAKTCPGFDVQGWLRQGFLPFTGGFKRCLKDFVIQDFSFN